MVPEIMPVIDTNFKDDSPLNTVERIKGILNTYGIKLEERWKDSGVPHCYSMRLSIFGTVFGTNGKGVTKELTLASAYGELMERLQAGRIFKNDKQTGDVCEDSAYNKSVPMQELLNRNKKWYSIFTQKTQQLTGCKITEEELLKQYSDEEGNVAVTPFYCVNKQSHEYLPTKLLNTVYTTNGCAAGNTTEEAIVQAISEIMERSFSDRILMGGIVVPDVPEEILRSCTVAYEIIQFLRSQNFRVIVKDCSLGTKFPVVCVCLINRNTGRYHTHFGAYPNFEIALQRTLTESFQGLNLEKVAHFENFSRKKTNSFDIGNIVNQMAKGTSERDPGFFMDSSEFPLEHKWFSGTNNRELLKECIEFFCEQGYDVLIRDYSSLGFPTYQVIIPGFSEVFTYRMDPKHNDVRYRSYSAKVLRDPASATLEELMGFIMNLNEATKRKLPPQAFSQQANLPVRLSGPEERYFLSAAMANISYTLGRTADAVRYIDDMLSQSINKDEEKLICIKRYLNLRADRYDESEIRSVLEFFHRPETVQNLYAAISAGRNPLDSVTLRCNLQCDKSCLLYGVCEKKYADALSELIRAKIQKMDNSRLEAQLVALL